MATQGQVNYLKILRVKDIPDPLLMSVANQLITHAVAVPRVKDFIARDYLPDITAEKKTA
jgi:hypothetical protein